MYYLSSEKNSISVHINLQKLWHFTVRYIKHYKKNHYTICINANVRYIIIQLFAISFECDFCIYFLLKMTGKGVNSSKISKGGMKPKSLGTPGLKEANRRPCRTRLPSDLVTPRVRSEIGFHSVRRREEISQSRPSFLSHIF